MKTKSNKKSTKDSHVNRENLSWLVSQSMETKLEMLKHHFEISRFLINEILDEEVISIAGQRYKHSRPHDGRYTRWGYNPGSVNIGNEHIRVDVPRVYDKSDKKNISLSVYEKLKQIPEVQDQLLKGVIKGLSMEDYQEVIRKFHDSFGLSRSNVSRAFIEQSAEKLKAFEQRDLSQYEFVSLFIDGKYLAKEQIVIVLGVSGNGNKIPLGFIQTTTENSTSIKQLLNKLVDRGLSYESGLLCIIDGSKGIRKAVEEVFGKHAVIQRCQWHKRENVVSYLKEEDQMKYRRKMQLAYNTESYREAKVRLNTIHDELEQINLSAARSLEEGLEETLTLHRLQMNVAFGRSFTTTNCIENLNSQLNKYIGKVKNWKNSKQRYRWIASSLLEIEQRMKKAGNYKKLYLLQEAVTNEVLNKIKKQKKAA